MYSEVITIVQNDTILKEYPIPLFDISFARGLKVVE